MKPVSTRIAGTFAQLNPVRSDLRTSPRSRAPVAATVARCTIRAARLVQRSTIATTGARDLGLSRRADLTGFNWSNVPAILVETGFLTNPAERRRLESSAYQWRVARGLVAGVRADLKPR